MKHHHALDQQQGVPGDRRQHVTGDEPGDRRGHRRGRAGQRRGRPRRHRRGRRRRSPPGATPHWPSARDPVQLPRAAQRAQARAGRDHHQRARQGGLRRARRGQPRPGGRRVRLRHPASAQGRIHRERVDQGRRLLDPPAAGPGRHHQPVQLPRHGADVVLPHRDRGRQHRRAQAVARRTRRRRCGWPSCGPKPVCRQGCSTCCRATRPPSTSC